MSHKTAIIGMGLIGSSIALNLKNKELSQTVIGIDQNPDVLKKVRGLGLTEETHSDFSAVADCDLIFLCIPVGVMGPVSHS